MKKILLFVGLYTLIAFALGFTLSQSTVWKPKAKAANATRVLVVTGGHDHDADFYSVFDDAAISESELSKTRAQRDSMERGEIAISKQEKAT